MSDMDEFLEMFFVECDELLEALSTGLRAMDSATGDVETVHSVFRAVHSMKGAAAAFGLSDLVTFAHRFETVLDELRSEKLDATQSVMVTLHRSSDFLSDLVTAARQSECADQARLKELLNELDDIIGHEDVSTEDEDEGIEFVPLTLDLTPLDGGTPLNTFQIIFSPDAELYRSGNDPVALLFSLQQLGETEVTIDHALVPLLRDWRAEETYLSWKVTLITDEPVGKVNEIFEFVADCAAIEISSFEQPIQNDFFEKNPVATVGSQEQKELANNPQNAEEHKSVELDENKSEKAAKTSNGPGGNANAAASIRVSLERVDKLMNMIGELVIKEAMLYQVIETAGLTNQPDVVSALDGIRQLAGDIQESVMSIRAQPLKLVFQRMHRIVREAADATGKKVRLDTIGENTEVDKTMIERLIDPLTHMIRNSVDHGLEDAVTRQRRGKALEGTITLSAAHRSGRVLIEVSDDGGGIDRERVRKIAEDRGLIAPGTQLSSSEIDSLLFLPGFSSKEQVSALSGRGVGLDVVRREIMSLGGRVMIQSTENKGTKFSITLPLTLAVLEGMLIQLGDQSMVLPITAVQETLRPSSSCLHYVGKTGKLLLNRGELIPIVDIACTFGIRDEPAPLEDGVLIVIENDSHRRAALFVDAIFDQRQVVIKSLEENYGKIPGVSAATILGDGNIALIIDPEEIIFASGMEHARNNLKIAAYG
ncbi:MAG: chemotaxis protein CheA [Rhodobacteraceae bacterium]|nr:MAG: chemotaxis protein CheA [Paracoccaceae bacterium]